MKNSKLTLNVTINGLDEYKKKLEEMLCVANKFNELADELNNIDISIDYKFPLSTKD